MNIRAILAALLVITAALPAGRLPLRHLTQTHRHRRSSPKRTTARTRRTRTTRRPVAVRIPTSRMTNRPSTPTTVTPGAAAGPARHADDFGEVDGNRDDRQRRRVRKPPVRSHSSRCRRRRRTHESRSRPRAPNSLKGEQTLRVDYDDDAAPTDGESYYEVELFFEDGSTKTIGLTASETGRERRRVGLRRVSGAHRGNGRARD